MAHSTAPFEHRPDPLGEVFAGLGVEVDRVEHGAPDVVLALGGGGVADPDRPGVVVAAQVAQLLLGQLLLAPDPVHDLELLVAVPDVGHEVEEVVGLALEPEGVQAPEHEGGVADPGVAVVVVALTAGGLGQRGGGRGQQRPGGGVGEALEGQGGPLEVALPGMLGEHPLVDPAPPELGRPLHPLEGLVGVGRRGPLGPVLLRRGPLRARPAQCREGPVALAQGGPGVRASAFEADPEVGDQPQLDVALAAVGDRLAVALVGVLPAGLGTAVVEHRLAVQAQLDVADDALHRAEQDVLGLVVGRWPPVVPERRCWWYQGPTHIASRTTIQPPRARQVVSRTSVPGR